MSLQIANYPDPQGAPGDVIPAAYCYIVQTNISYGAAITGRMVANIYRSANACNAGAPPVDQVAVALGLSVTPSYTFPTLVQIYTTAAQIQAANPSNTPDASINRAVYEALQGHPKFAGLTLTEVP